MKKTLTKVLVSCAAVMSVAAMMAVSASAADVSYDAANKQILNTAKVPVENGQATIIVIDDGVEASALAAENIYYIDQLDAADAATSWATIAADLKDGDYVLKMGGEGVSAEKYSFKVGSKPTKSYLIGDVDTNEAVDASDALAILQHYAQIEGKVIAAGSDKFKLADVNKDTTVDASDALLVLQHYAQIEGKTLTETIEVAAE